MSESAKHFDLVIIGEEEYRKHTQDVLRAPTVTPSGDMIRMGDVADVEFVNGPAKISHTDLDRSITISMNVDPTVPLDEARVELREIGALAVGIGGELFSDAMGPPGTYEGTYEGMIDHNITAIVRALGGQAPAGCRQARFFGCPRK